MESPSPDRPVFDYEVHRRNAVEAYRTLRHVYEQAVHRTRDILDQALKASGILVLSIQGRTKELDSLGNKAIKPSEIEPNKPKYPDPLKDITDLAGVRVITFSPKSPSQIEEVIEKEFAIYEKTDKGKELSEEGKFGYQSIHYVVGMKAERATLPEYRQTANLTVEIQLRTILQHAWAEMEHDIQYKSATVIPTSIRRRFIALAGLLEIADREFQAVQEEDERIRSEARQSLEAGKLSGIEITPDALRSYLDHRFGPDRRSSDFSYEITAKNLRRMGFSNFQQIDECIRGFDDDRVSRSVYLSRQGQITRFEAVLHAGMGENYRRLHPWLIPQFNAGTPDWFLDRLQKAGLKAGSYTPPQAEDL
jgi:ppGpp synthetase/RelA/SpoT-type nucleotidyltranferase